MDPTSFASVLAGVKRMREQYVEDEVNEDKSGTNYANDHQTVESATPVKATSETPIERPIETSIESSVESQHNAQKLQEGEGNASTVRDGTPPISVERDSNRLNRIRGGIQMYSQIQVSPSQKQNPLLQSSLLKQKPLTFNKEILSDYYINPTLQILFLSLKYHQLHPEYVWRRIKKLNQGSLVNYRSDNSLKILLVVIDIESPQETLRKLNNICVKQDLTLIISWSFEQAGNYIAMLKENELSANKINLSIKGVKNNDFTSNIINTLTTVKTINKTDSINLMANHKTFKNIVKSNDLRIHGLGERKIKNLKSSFLEPFIFNNDRSNKDNEI